MFYFTYLEGLCERRHWSPPRYDYIPERDGYSCVAWVNGRQYRTERPQITKALARERAAMTAYMISRNQSVNNGQYPSGHDHGGMVQGVPEAIGSGRYRRSDALSPSTRRNTDSSGSGSSGSSPERRESVRYVRVYARR